MLFSHFKCISSTSFCAIKNFSTTLHIDVLCMNNSLFFNIQLSLMFCYFGWNYDDILDSHLCAHICLQYFFRMSSHSWDCRVRKYMDMLGIISRSEIMRSNFRNALRLLMYCYFAL